MEAKISGQPWRGRWYGVPGYTPQYIFTFKQKRGEEKRAYEDLTEKAGKEK